MENNKFQSRTITISVQSVTSSTRLTSVVRSDESEDVLVPEHDGLVDLAFPEPRLLIPAAEDLDGHVLATPVAEHHLAEAMEAYRP